MDKNKIIDLLDKLKNDKDYDKYLNLIIDEAILRKNEFEISKNSKLFYDSLNEHFEDIFDETNEPFNKIYIMDNNIREKIKQIKINKFKYENNDVICILI